MAEPVCSVHLTHLCWEQCLYQRFEPAPIHARPVRVPCLKRSCEACDLRIGELKLPCRNRERGVPHHALLAGDYLAPQLDSLLLSAVERDPVLNGPDRADRAHICPLRTEQGVQVQPLSVVQCQHTDFTFNPVCVDASGDAAGPASVTNPSACPQLGLTANPNLAPGLVPYDLTRGGSLFRFRATGNINQAAVYVQDSVTLGHWSLNGGLRVDRYDGLSSANGFEPRIGASYQIKKTSTVLRASFGRTFETPYNENLLLSSASGVGGLATNVFGAFGSVPLKAGVRNQFNTGLQQSIGKFLLLDGNYFWKYTDTAYDFDVLFNTPVTFPIAWRKSKLDGVGARASTTNLKGFQAYMTLGHTRARFYGPETGGLIFNSPVNSSVFRIDHDQALEQTTNLRYQRKKDSPWIDFTWRYDSGMVAGNVPDLASALALTGAQQAAIGFYCGGQTATINNPITSCSGSYGASRIVIPKAGTENADTNPPRIAPHHVFDLSVGTDNLLHTEPAHLTARFTVLNLANEAALYNFLSTFSGTHFVTPRSFIMTMGVNF